MSEDKKPEETQPEEQSPVENLAAALAAYPGAPTVLTIEGWKQQFGEVMASGFTDDELFVWRPITRREYVALQKEMATPKEGQEPLNGFDFEDRVVKACLLWSSVKDLDSKGGTIPTLSEQIMQNSNFTSPQLAGMLVVKL